MATIHFLLIYDLNKQKLIRKDEFSDGVEAATEYARWEQKNRGNRDLEIVLLGADSLETVEMTHGQYFDGVSANAPSRYLTA